MSIYTSPKFEFQPADSISKGVKWILIINIATFCLIKIFPPFQEFCYRELALMPVLFKPWQALSYMFLHFEFFHLFWNMLLLFFIGSSVEAVFGTRSFVHYYLICGVGGAIAGYAMGFFPSFDAIPVIGASGAMFGVLYACYRFFPEAIMYVFGVFPIKLKYFLIIAFLIDFVGLFSRNSHVAHFAHLGGLATGMLFFYHQERQKLNQQNSEDKKAHQEQEFIENMREEVDVILKKIHEKGMGALSKREKEILEKASKHYSDSRQDP